MHEVRFSIGITKKRYLEIYNSPAQQVIVTSNNGQKIQFPVRYLYDFVTNTGINGNFRIVYASNNKFVRMEKV